MKLSKDEGQKLVLGGLLFVGLIYVYFALLLGPLQTKQVSVKAQSDKLDPQIAAAKGLIAKSKSAEIDAPAAEVLYQQISALTPPGAPVAWFPPLVAGFFKDRGVDKLTTKLISESVEKNLPGFGRTVWALEFPRVDFVPFANAIADFENEEPLAEISGVTIDVNRDDQEAQHALITINRLVKK